MTAAEFRATLKRLGLRQRKLAGLLGVDVNTVNRWATGKVAPVPQYAELVLSLIEQLAAECRGKRGCPTQACPLIR